jgi:AmmeMemoRadiSam system protein B/AmmeMemoRadiSam system protein A
VRPPVHAGSWYPAGADALRAEIDRELAAASPRELSGPLIAAVGPHAGLRYSGRVAATVYAALRRQGVKRVFLLGPSHYEAFEGIALPAAELSAYGTPLGNLAVDREAVEALRGKPGFAGPASAHEREHSLEMHAIFLAAVAPSARLVPMVVGRVGTPAEARALADVIAPLLRAGDVVIASSDFTHYGASYGYVPFAVEPERRLAGLADEATAALAARDADAFYRHLTTTRDTICGREPLLVLLGLLPTGSHGERLASDTSGRMTGSFDSSVTYVAMAYSAEMGWGGLAPAAAGAPAAAASSVTAAGPGPAASPGPPAGPPSATGPASAASSAPGANLASATAGAPPVVLSGPQQLLALRMARRALEIVLAGGRPPDASALGVPADPVWQEPHGTFVTLERAGALRGCIGHIVAIEPLWQDIRDNAMAAALEDPRFRPVRREELAGLDIEVSVLTPLRPVPGADGFVVGRHGVVLSAEGRRAVFLPQVAPEQGWDRDTTLARLSRKAGLAADAWRSPAARFEVFEAQVFGEATGKPGP